MRVIAVDPAVRVGVDDMVRACPELTVVVDRPDVVEAVEAGAGGLLRRSEVRPDRLRPAIRATADGSFTVPSALLGDHGAQRVDVDRSA